MRNNCRLPDSVTVAHVVLVHSVEVRILVGQPEGDDFREVEKVKTDVRGYGNGKFENLGLLARQDMTDNQGGESG